VPDSWKWVFDSDRYKGRIGVVAEAGDLCQLGLLYLGKDMNTTDPAALAAVEKMLIRQKPNILVFHDDNGQDLLLNGDVDIVIEYNGDIARVMREDDDLDFVVPREGSQLSSDCLCIPKGAPNPGLANEFINYLLDAHAGAEIARTIRYPTPNAAAAALMGPDYRDNPVIFPPQAVLDHSHYAKYNGEAMARQYEEIVTRVRAA
jgi:spermidine/putrescine transport system substrate-binding protein